MGSWLLRFAAKGPALSILVAAIALANACTTTPYHNRKKGIVVADFYADTVGSVLEMIDKDLPIRPVAVIEVTPMDNFRVFELPEGQYTWRELREPGRVTALSNHFEISVQADKINYIGSMLIKSYPKGPQISVVNQATQALQRLQTDFKTMESQYPFVINLMRQHH